MLEKMPHRTHQLYFISEHEDEMNYIFLSLYFKQRRDKIASECFSMFLNFFIKITKV